MGESPYTLCTELSEVKEPFACFLYPFPGKRANTGADGLKIAYLDILSSAGINPTIF